MPLTPKATVVLSLLSLFVVGSLAAAAGPPSLPWCFVRKDCNQQNPNSDWNKGTCKDGKMQSPIDIDVSKLANLDGDASFSLNEDDYKVTFFKVNNDGKHVEVGSVKTQSGQKPTIQYGDRGAYTLEEVHFHWGPNDKDGSEHHLNKKTFSGEIHLVHYKSSFPDYDAAKKSGEPGSLANFAIILQAGSGEDVVTPAIQPLLDVLPKIAEQDKWAPVEGNFDLHAIIRTQDKAAAYDGSATTPPCAEVVQWFVGLTPVPVASETLKKFRTTIKGVDNKPLDANFRKAQPANGRTIGVIEIKH